jgi:hypothetical protein
MSGQVPLVYNEQVSHGTIATLAQTPGVVSPAGISYWSGDTPWATVKNASLGVERDLGFQTALDVSYVGNWSTKQGLRENMNAVPLGANFESKNISPVTGSPLTQVGSSLERVNYPGYQDMNKFVFYGHSNYNSLQTSVQHRLSSGFLLGVAYTWSKALGVTSYDPLVPNNDARNYGPLGQDRRQSLSINYSYSFPNPGNAALRAVIGNWTLSGLTTYISGAPFSPTYNGGGVDFTGSQNEGARLDEVGNPKENQAPGLIFNPNAFAIPAVGSIGNLGVNAFSLPGYNDWDVSLTKFIPMGFEKGNGLEVQVQGFNVWNHPQFNNYGNSITSLSSFGKPTGDTGGRVLALDLHYRF